MRKHGGEHAPVIAQVNYESKATNHCNWLYGIQSVNFKLWTGAAGAAIGSNIYTYADAHIYANPNAYAESNGYTDPGVHVNPNVHINSNVNSNTNMDTHPDSNTRGTTF